MELQQLWKEIYLSDEEEGQKVDKDERSQEDKEEKFDQPGAGIKRFKKLKEKQVGLEHKIEEVQELLDHWKL